VPIVARVAATVGQTVEDDAAPVVQDVPSAVATTVPTVAIVDTPVLTAPVPAAVEDVAVPAALLAAAPDLSAVLTPDAFDHAATVAAAMTATLLGDSTAVDRALLGLGAGSSAVATLSRFGTGRALAPGSNTPASAPTGPLAHAPAAPADAGGNAGANSGAGHPAAVLGEFLAGLLVCAALCCAVPTRRLTWWFPEVVVGPG
jgi:hypothetical protein